MTTPHKPMVTIGIPVYNREKLLGRTLDCLLAQTYTDFEILISDNASTDNTETLCREYAAKDSRFRYVRQPHNLGILGNFTYVKDNAWGKYFQWCSSDDLCEPEFLGSLVECMEANPALAVAMTDVKTVVPTGEVIHIDRMEAIRLPTVVKDYEANRRLFFNYGDPNHLYHCIFGLYRTDVAQKCKLPRKTWKNMIADLEVPYLAQAAIYGGIATLNVAPMKIYYSHSGSTYVKEMGKRNVFDKAMRGIEIRLSLIHTALFNPLDFATKMSLVNRLVASSLWSVSNFIKGKSVISLQSVA